MVITNGEEKMSDLDYLTSIERNTASYSDAFKIIEDSGFDREFFPILNAFEVTSNGTIRFQTPTRPPKDRIIEVKTGRIYPIHVRKIYASGTNISATNIIGYRK